ncbi:MAG: hypothetical protein HYW48_08595 [Deltaproteobacteria bacterium]|nr:hypothetical protein [Deltaproteobacteria bacterium]
MRDIYIIGEPQKHNSIKQVLNGKLKPLCLAPNELNGNALQSRTPMILLPWNGWREHLGILIDGRRTLVVGDFNFFPHAEEHVLAGRCCFLRENCPPQIIFSTITEILRQTDQLTW